MAGMNVLSDILKGGIKLERTSNPKGKDLSDSPNSVATVFAAMLSSFMNSNVDSKGQNSQAGQESEEMQSTEKPVLSVQNLNGQESMLGYVNFALSNLFQPMLQGDLPAGKEANSGNDVNLETGDLAVAKALLTNVPIVLGNLELEMLNLVSLDTDEVSAQSGMTTSEPQGDNPAITELDKYRQVITDLLIALSGEITDPSLKGNRLSLEGSETTGLRQEMAKIVQGWMTVTMTDDVVEDAQVTDGQKGIQPLLDALSAELDSGEHALKAKVSTLLAALYPKLSQGSEGAEGPKASQEMKATTHSKVEGVDPVDPAAKGGTELFLKQLKTDDLKPVANKIQDTELLATVKQKSGGASPQKLDGMDTPELIRGKDVQTLSPSAFMGALSNILSTNVAEGKTVALPVLEQVSAVIREQVMNRSQDLKQLEIQLHPVDLGKIQIGMRWENGQLHLIVQASEAATGQLLQNQLPDLRQNLTNQGVNCGMLQMGQGGEGQQNPRGDESQRTFNQDTSQNEGEEQSSVSNFLSLGQDGINRINVTA